MIDFNDLDVKGDVGGIDVSFYNYINYIHLYKSEKDETKKKPKS